MFKTLIQIRRPFTQIFNSNHRFKSSITKFKDNIKDDIIKVKKKDEILYYRNDCLIEKEFKNGNKIYLEGSKGKEYFVSAVNSDGNKFYFEGSKDNEKLVKIEFLDGKTFFFECDDANNMSLHKIIKPCGEVIIY